MYDVRLTTYDLRRTTYDVRRSMYDVRRTTSDVRRRMYHFNGDKDASKDDVVTVGSSRTELYDYDLVDVVVVGARRS
jgi:hypothetical protein